MEPKDSLPHSQVPATCPYPGPHRSSPCPHIPLTEDPSYTPIHAWVSQVVSFLQVSPPKPCIRLSSPPYAIRALPISFFSFLSPEQYGWGVQIIKLLIMYFSALPCYLVLFRPKYSPQHPILEHPQPTFLVQFEQPSFTPIKNNRQNYTSVYHTM